MTEKDYLGDGVYATFDGYHIWLEATVGGTVNRIALHPGVFEALLEYQRKLVERSEKESFEEEDVNG